MTSSMDAVKEQIRVGKAGDSLGVRNTGDQIQRSAAHLKKQTWCFGDWRGISSPKLDQRHNWTSVVRGYAGSVCIKRRALEISFKCQWNSAPRPILIKHMLHVYGFLFSAQYTDNKFLGNNETKPSNHNKTKQMFSPLCFRGRSRASIHNLVLAFRSGEGLTFTL